MAQAKGRILKRLLLALARAMEGSAYKDFQAAIDAAMAWIDTQPRRSP